jgi:hypothetical protein
MRCGSRWMMGTDASIEIHGDRANTEKVIAMTKAGIGYRSHLESHAVLKQQELRLNVSWCSQVGYSDVGNMDTAGARWYLIKSLAFGRLEGGDHQTHYKENLAATYR